LTKIIVKMTVKLFHLVYDIEFLDQVLAIDSKFHSLIRRTIEKQLAYKPDVETRNRKRLVRTTVFGARWELRFGKNNQFRVFYSVHADKAEVHVLAVGTKERNRLFIGGKEVKL
jgi:mRNA-degrading endonuclease RelE of RelBE toxin-antitoxin system